jgi:hypothetical protein
MIQAFPLIRRVQSLIFGIGLLLLLIPLNSLSQGISSGGGEGTGRIEEDFKFMPIPYLNYKMLVWISPPDKMIGASIFVSAKHFDFGYEFCF